MYSVPNFFFTKTRQTNEIRGKNKVEKNSEKKERERKRKKKREEEAACVCNRRGTKVSGVHACIYRFLADTAVILVSLRVCRLADPFPDISKAHSIDFPPLYGSFELVV